MAQEIGRVAINPGDSRHSSIDEIIETAQLADRAGIDTLFFGELWGWDIHVLLGLIAARTDRIRLGAAIANIFARSPGAFAQTAATLDVVSRGRFLIGLGIGTRAIAEDWHGVPFDRPALRLRETVAVIRQALSGAPLEYQGEIFRVRRFRLSIAPVQPRIPILIGANKPSNVELAGAVADAWSPSYAAQRTLPWFLDHLRAGARGAGRDPAAIDVAPIVRCLVTSDPEPFRQIIRRELAYYLGSPGSLHPLTFKRTGIFLDEMARIQEAFAKDPRSAERYATDEMVDAFAAIGTAEECRRWLAGWREAGATLPIVSAPLGTPIDALHATIEALGRPGGRSAG